MPGLLIRGVPKNCLIFFQKRGRLVRLHGYSSQSRALNPISWQMFPLQLGVNVCHLYSEEASIWYQINVDLCMSNKLILAMGSEMWSIHQGRSHSNSHVEEQSSLQARDGVLRTTKATSRQNLQSRIRGIDPASQKWCTTKRKGMAIRPHNKSSCAQMDCTGVCSLKAHHHQNQSFKGHGASDLSLYFTAFATQIIAKPHRDQGTCFQSPSG